jgi:hypothetical protein
MAVTWVLEAHEWSWFLICWTKRFLWRNRGHIEVEL